MPTQKTRDQVCCSNFVGWTWNTIKRMFHYCVDWSHSAGSKRVRKRWTILQNRLQQEESGGGISGRGEGSWFTCSTRGTRSLSLRRSTRGLVMQASWWTATIDKIIDETLCHSFLISPPFASMPHLTLFLLSAEASNRLKRVFLPRWLKFVMVRAGVGDGDGRSKCTVGGIACDNAGSCGEYAVFPSLWHSLDILAALVTMLQLLAGGVRRHPELGTDCQASVLCHRRHCGGKIARSQEGSCVYEKNFHPSITHFIAAAVCLSLPDV